MIDFFLESEFVHASCDDVRTLMIIIIGDVMSGAASEQDVLSSDICIFFIAFIALAHAFADHYGADDRKTGRK
jgi:hypothetical protein